MFILTRASAIENCKDNILRVHDVATEKRHLDAGYHRHDRNYEITEQCKEYTVVCPEFRNDAKGLEPIVVIPDFLVSGRPYPVYVYLYAIDIYSNAPEKGQRWAAEETRKQFGLETFAHTTLGRALKAFARAIGVAEAATGGAEPGTADGGKVEPPHFPTVKKTEALRKQASAFLRSKLGQAWRQTAAAACGRLAREWFREYQRFLL
jgi:hypothetical protein